MYYRKEIVKILKCYFVPKKSYGTLSKGAIFLANPIYFNIKPDFNLLFIFLQNLF